LTEKKRLTADDLTVDLAQARSFHLICSPLRTIEQVQGVLSKRIAPNDDHTLLCASRPLFIWEPVPDLCTPEELANTLKALRYVDIISPNHEELAAIFSFTHPPEGPSKEAIEDHAQRLFDAGIGPDKQGAVVVRAGAEGCFVLSPRQRQWLPAYHTDASRVVDPTGGGNGFLGGLAVGLVRTDFDVVEAARWGSVAASFTIEQVGMPSLTPSAGSDDGTREKWNGVSVQERLAEFRKRTA
jgi:sugar/nucleoside kinase (ribokinase family)